MRTGTFFLGFSALASLCGCGGEDARRLEAPPELTEMLRDVMGACGDGWSESCRKAMNLPPGASFPQLSLLPGFWALEPFESCRSKNYAELEVAAVFSSGTVHVRAGFARYEDGAWFLKRVKSVDESTPALCSEIPNLHSAKEAKVALADKSDWVRWSERDGRSFVSFRHLIDHGCGVETLMIGDSPEEKPRSFEVKCWYTDGFPASLENMPPRFRLEVPHLYLQLAFSDGTATAIEKVESPYFKGRGEGSEATRDAPGPGRGREEPKPSNSPVSSGLRKNRALVMGSGGGKVFLDGAFQCEAPCEIQVPVGDGISHEIRIRKEGEGDRVASWRPKSVAEPLLPLRRSSGSSPR